KPPESPDASTSGLSGRIKWALANNIE
ncbi:MAG: hypothetical protein QOF25_5375, partial [Mycobacterium sp.]|nr:hypothetical protein [Mycobacterium sp.]